MQRWGIGWRSTDIYPTRAILHVDEYPWWSTIPEYIFEFIDVLFRHRLCGPPEWLWHIPIWRGKDSDGDWEHSIGSMLHTFSQKCMLFSYKYQTVRQEIDVTDEWLEKYGYKDPLADLED